jgi:hypothetical protein
MKNLIRQILKEEETNKVLKNYIIKLLQRQVDSGLIPKLDSIDLYRKGFRNYFEQINNWYHEFVGGEEEAFKLFKKYLEDKSITDEDIKKIGRMVFPSDHYKIIIKRIYNLDYKGNRIIGSNEELEFGFSLLVGQFETSEGIMTLEELYNDINDDIRLDVEDVLRSEIEDYVDSIANNFGLEFDVITSHWY